METPLLKKIRHREHLNHMTDQLFLLWEDAEAAFSIDKRFFIFLELLAKANALISSFSLKSLWAVCKQLVMFPDLYFFYSVYYRHV